MRTKLFFFILLPVLLFSLVSVGQDTAPSKPKPQQKKTFWDKASIGGYLGAQFGTVTNIDISPMLYYEVIPSLYTGVGFTYLYYKDKRYYPAYSSSGYGGSILARYHVWQDLFVQAEYDPLNLVYYDYYDDGSGNIVRGPKSSTWVHDLLIGAGYRAWLGGKAFATLAIFYNVNETYYSPNRNPIIRIGFGIGL